MAHSNSLVNKVLGEDAERFYKEEGRNKWYREALSKILDHEIKRLATEEENMYTDRMTSEIMSSISTRKAYRLLSGLLRTGTLFNRGDDA